MTPSQLAPTLKTLLHCGLTPFIWGAPGIGKSDIVGQVASDLNLELRDVRASQMDPTDIKGFPAPDAKAKAMFWLKPDFLPTKGKGLLFLDELNSAPSAVQASFYQLILNRCVGNYTLPPGWVIVAAGNRDTDRSVTFRMPDALANRMAHLDLEPDVDDWVEYAQKVGMNPIMPAFMRFRPGLLFERTTAAKSPAFPSPRTWSFVNTILQQQMPKEIEKLSIEAAVGVGAAAEFVGFMQVARQVPKLSAIQLAPDAEVVPETAAGQHAVCQMMINALTEDSYPRFLIYVRRLPAEFQVVFHADAIRKDNNITNTPEYAQWTMDNAKVVI